MDPTSKLTTGLQQTLRASEPDSQVPVIVRYAEGRRVLRHREVMPGVRESYHYRLRPFVHMHATPGALQQLEADTEIVRIYQDLPVRAYLDTSVSHIAAPRLWEEGFLGRGVRIAIVDTGLDVTHPDFVDRIGDVADLTGEGPGDRHGHGTHCASAAAGSGAASAGRYRGVAPEATIYAAKVLGANGQGMMSDVMAGVEWAVDRGVQVISLSLGGPGPCDGSDALSETCDAAMEQGIVVVVAGGNDGPASYTVGSPGCARQVITVGACDESGHIAPFSSRGPTGDGRVKPDVVLPGVDIIAARAANTAMGDVVDKYYTSASGTSMATPHAAGVCALLLEAEPELTPAQVKQRLMETAITLGESGYAQGDGRVDAWRTRHSQVQPEDPEPTPPPPGPVTGSGCVTAAVKLFLRLKPAKRG